MAAFSWALGQLLGLLALQFGAALLELGQVLRCDSLGLALRDEEVAREAVAHLDDVAQVAEVDHLFHQNHLHGRVLSQCRSV
ncbi:hypothetical protein MASR1M97_09550 [Candidatus Desulfobacillus denitrificans]